MNPTKSKYLEMQARCDSNRRKAQFVAESSGEPFEGPEKDLQGLIIADLQAMRAYVVHSRTDRRTTQQPGVPDIVAALPQGVTLWIEAKKKGGKLSKEQTIARHCLLALSHHHAVIYCMEDWNALKRALNL